jgi:hypothetical protein
VTGLTLLGGGSGGDVAVWVDGPGVTAGVVLVAVPVVIIVPEVVSVAGGGVVLTVLEVGSVVGVGGVLTVLEVVSVVGVGGVLTVLEVVSVVVAVVSVAGEMVGIVGSGGDAVVLAVAIAPADTAAAAVKPAASATTWRRVCFASDGPRGPSRAGAVDLRRQGAGSAIGRCWSAASVNTASGYSTTCSGTSNVARQSTDRAWAARRRSRVGSGTTPGHPR